MYQLVLLHITYTPVKRSVGIFDERNALLREDRIVTDTLLNELYLSIVNEKKKIYIS